MVKDSGSAYSKFLTFVAFLMWTTAIVYPVYHLYHLLNCNKYLSIAINGLFTFYKRK